MEFYIYVPEKFINTKNTKTPEDNVQQIVDGFKQIYHEAQFAEIFRNPDLFVIKMVYVEKLTFIVQHTFLSATLDPETNKVEFFERPSGKPWLPIKNSPGTTIRIFGNTDFPGDITITDEGNPEILFVERKDPSGNITKFQMNKMILLTFLYRLGASAFTKPEDN